MLEDPLSCVVVLITITKARMFSNACCINSTSRVSAGHSVYRTAFDDTCSESQRAEVSWLPESASWRATNRPRGPRSRALSHTAERPQRFHDGRPSLSCLWSGNYTHRKTVPFVRVGEWCVWRRKGQTGEACGPVSAQCGLALMS